MLAAARRSLRHAALIQAGLFVCALAGAWGHFAQVRHGFCADHGEVIHLEGKQEPTRGVTARSAVGGAHGAHSAHSCAMLSFLSSSASTHGPKLADLGRPSSTALPRPPNDAGAPRAIPLLLQAPKASPPPA